MRCLSFISIFLLFFISVIPALIIPLDSDTELSSELHHRGPLATKYVLGPRNPPQQPPKSPDAETTAKDKAASQRRDNIVKIAINIMAYYVGIEFRKQELMSAKEYFDGIIRRAQFRDDQLLMVMIYIHRLSGEVTPDRDRPQRMIQITNILCTLIMIAHKTTTERGYTNEGWVEIFSRPSNVKFEPYKVADMSLSFLRVNEKRVRKVMKETEVTVDELNSVGEQFFVPKFQLQPKFYQAKEDEIVKEVTQGAAS